MSTARQSLLQLAIAQVRCYFAVVCIAAIATASWSCQKSQNATSEQRAQKSSQEEAAENSTLNSADSRGGLQLLFPASGPAGDRIPTDRFEALLYAKLGGSPSGLDDGQWLGGLGYAGG